VNLDAIAPLTEKHSWATMLSTLLIFAELAAKDLLRIHPRIGDPEAHLCAAENWLKRAHDESPDDGVSYGYSIRGGWRPSYRETTGYIAITFFNLARHRNEPDYRNRALRMCRWLLSVQNPDGSFSNPRYGNGGLVFDTGQDLFGLVRAYEETDDVAFYDGARRAARWLVDVADTQGRWTRNEHLDTPHVYNTRTAWALLRMNQVEPDPDRERIARANLDWAVSEQQSSGFFDHCAFERESNPFTHTIAYTTRGLLESGELLRDPVYTDAARRCANAALEHVHEDGFMPGEITIDGKAAASYCCLTGNCQFSIVWAKLFLQTANEDYRRAAVRTMKYVMRHQDIHAAKPEVRGAIKGAQPIWGRYAPLSFPNWPTKFFVDAMVLCKPWL
jgi:hypothetical protein